MQSEGYHRTARWVSCAVPNSLVSCLQSDMIGRSFTPYDTAGAGGQFSCDSHVHRVHYILIWPAGMYDCNCITLKSLAWQPGSGGGNGMFLSSFPFDENEMQCSIGKTCCVVKCLFVS